MAANQVIGQILTIGPTQSITTRKGTTFQKRDLVISVRRYDPNTGEPVTDWENTPKLSFTGEKCNDLDRFQVGQMVAVSFELQGRKYVNENTGVSDIITEARPYKIELYGQRQAQQPTVQPAQAPAPAPAYPQQPMMAPTPQSAPQQAPQQQPYVQPQQQGFKEPF